MLSSRLFIRLIAKSPDVYLLKIITLSIAFACSTLIILFSINEFGYDRFHENHESIFRVLQRNNREDWSGNRLSNRIPSIVTSDLKSQKTSTVARVKVMDEITVVVNDKSFHNQKIHAADPSITNIFTFKSSIGRLGSFESNGAVLLSTTAAQTYFGSEDVAGRELKITTVGDTLLFKVAAVYEDFPGNSHELFQLFLHFDETAIRALSFNPDNSGLYGKILSGHAAGLASRVNKPNSEIEYRFQPLAEIYFGPRVLGEDARHGDHYSIVILVFITSLILFFALSSFINLTTLTLPNRSKELAIKKLAGTNHWGLQGIFLSESFSLVGISMIIGLLLLVITAGWRESILSMNILTLLFQGNMSVVFTLSMLFLVIGIAPLFLTSKFARATPTRLLSTDTITFPRFKRTIMFLQLGISIFLIVASMVIKRQINYSLLKEPGRNYDQIVYLSYPHGLSQEGLASQRAAWKKYNPNIVDVMATSQLPGQIHSREVDSKLFFMSVDPGFRDFFDLKLKEGRWFRPNDGDSLFLLNSKGAALSGALNANAIGVFADLGGDFNKPEKPIKLNLAPAHHYNYLCVRILEVDIRETVAYLTRQFGLKVTFMNHRFEEWIAYQDRLNKLSGLLAIVSGLLSCCAVYGLSISLVRDKLKQIAIHKLFGASIYNIMHLLAREFARQTLLAILVFGPATYIIMNEVLRGFVYATHFTWTDPLLPLAYCGFIIALLCGFQAFGLNRADLTSALKA